MPGSSWHAACMRWEWLRQVLGGGVTSTPPTVPWPSTPRGTCGSCGHPWLVHPDGTSPHPTCGVCSAEEAAEQRQAADVCREALAGPQ